MENELEQINDRITNIEMQIEMQSEIDGLKRQKARIVREIDESKKKAKEYV